MNNWKKVTFVGLSGLVLGACGGGVDENQVSENSLSVSSSIESVSSEPEQQEESSSEATDTENVTESEFGTMTIHSGPTEVNETQQSGAMNVTVEAVQKGFLEVAPGYEDMFDGRKELTVVTVKFVVENTSDDTLMIYPDQSTIVTNTKKQVDADLWLSDSVGGDYIGQVIKDGSVIYLFEEDPEAVTDFQLIVGSASDSDFNSLSDDLTFNFTFE